MSRDYRDDVIEVLAAENVELREELAIAQNERDGYRLVAVAGINCLHDLNTEFDLARSRHLRTVDAYRELRMSLLPAEGSSRAA